jgi:hypothetical protein
MCCAHNLWMPATITFSPPVQMKALLLPCVCMERSPSWEADSHLASQEILYILWNPKFHYRVHNSPPSARPCITFHNQLSLCGGDLLAPCPTPKLEGRHYRFFATACSIIRTSFQIWRPSPPFAVPWRQGPTWHGAVTEHSKSSIHFHLSFVRDVGM